MKSLPFRIYDRGLEVALHVHEVRVGEITSHHAGHRSVVRFALGGWIETSRDLWRQAFDGRVVAWNLDQVGVPDTLAYRPNRDAKLTIVRDRWAAAFAGAMAGAGLPPTTVGGLVDGWAVVVADLDDGQIQALAASLDAAALELMAVPDEQAPRDPPPARRPRWWHRARGDRRPGSGQPGGRR